MRTVLVLRNGLLCACTVYSAPTSAWTCGAQYIFCAMQVCAGCAYAPKRLCPCARLSQCAWGTALREARARRTALHMTDALVPTTRVRGRIGRVQRTAHRCGSAHAHTGSLAHAHTANAAHAHLCGLVHAHGAIQRTRTGMIRRTRIRPIQRHKHRLRR